MDENYNRYYNKGNDCDVCKHQYICGRDGDVVGCSRGDEGLDCEFIELYES